MTKPTKWLCAQRRLRSAHSEQSLRCPHGKDLFIRFTASAFCKLLSIYVFRCFPFGFEGRMWDLIVSVPDHCLSFYYEESLGL